MDEGVLWTHHHRVFWMFHESHHKYEHLGARMLYTSRSRSLGALRVKRSN